MQKKQKIMRPSAAEAPIKTALAAFGMSGQVFHAPLITAHPGFQLVKVLERSGSGNAMEQYPAVKSVCQMGDILADPDIELVVINTPEYTHYALAREALEAGKHVIVEKAFTVTSREGKLLIELAQKQGRMLSVFQNSRFHGDFRTIREIIQARSLGQLVNCEMHYDRYRPTIQPGTWKEKSKPGTGSLYNLGVHMIDQALVLFGWPHALFADVGIQRLRGKVSDYFEVVLYYDQLKVILRSSYLVRIPGPRYILHGTAGSFIKYGSDPQEALLKAGHLPGTENWGTEPEAFWGNLEAMIDGINFKGKVETLRGSYLDYYDNIFEVMRHGSPLLVKPAEALQAIMIIEAALQSNQTRQVVSLDKLKHLYN